MRKKRKMHTNEKRSKKAHLFSPCKEDAGESVMLFSNNSQRKSPKRAARVSVWSREM